MRHIIRIRWAVFLALPLLWAVGIGDASAASTLTGTIQGTVVDEGGNPLAGVTIVIQSESLIRDRAARSDTRGNFFAPDLAPGNYDVTARLEGFQSVRQTTEVRLDQTTMLEFVLAEGEYTETVTVVATKAVVDKTDTSGTLSLNKDFTETLPIGRSYQTLLQIAPGVVDQQDANPNMLGGTQNSNVYQLDGVSITDPVTGTFGSNINYDLIEAMDVKLTGVSAEYGGFQGGLSNVITKSGANDPTGSLRDQITSPSFESTNTSAAFGEFAPEREVPEISAATGNPCLVENPPGSGILVVNTADPDCYFWSNPSIEPQLPKKLTHEVQGTFGGPIVRDSAWVYVSYSRNDNVGVGRLESGPSYPDTFQGDNSSIKLTWQVVNDHKLQYTYFEDPADTTRCYNGLFLQGRDNVGCWDTEFIDFQKQGGFSWTGNWTGLWGDKILTDVKLTHWENGFNSLEYPGSPAVLRPDLIFESPAGLGSGLAAGNAPYWDFTSLTGFDAKVFAAIPETRSRDQYEAKATLFLDTADLGTHTFKVGVDYHEQTSVGQSILSGNALFFGIGWVQSPFAGGDPYDPDNRYWLQWYDFALPGTAATETKTTALYVQDDWQLNDRWSFNLGVRFEKNDNTNDIGEKVFDQTGFSPRLGASYDLTGEGKHVIKATAARYLDSIELSTLDFFARAAGGQSAYDIYFNRPGSVDPGPDGIPGTADDDYDLLPGRPVIPGPGEDCSDYITQPCWDLDTRVRPDVDTNTFADDLKPESIDELTLSYEHSFSPTLGASVRGIRREWSDIVGRTFTYRYDAGPDTIPGTADDGAAETLLFLDNRDYLKREYNSVQLQVEKRFSNNWSVLGNYTWAETKGTDNSRSTDQGFATYGQYPGVPQSTNNRFGILPWSVQSVVNVYGSYQVPLDSKRHSLLLGGGLLYRSGYHFSQIDQSQSFVVDTGTDLVQDAPLGTPANAVIDPDGTPGTGDEFIASERDQVAQVNLYDSRRGSFEQPDWWRLDLSAVWHFDFSKKAIFETRFEVYNVTNEQKPVTVSTAYFADPDSASDGRANYLFGYPTTFSSFQRPRRYQVIFAVLW